jgi:hypothetical protein
MGDGEEGLGAEEEGSRSGEHEGRKNSIFFAMFCICDRNRTQSCVAAPVTAGRNA